MSQRITSIYKLVTLPAIYEAIQSVLGAKKVRRFLADGPLKTKPGDRVLDVGCGPAALRAYLGDVEYLGMDLNAPHIAQAQKTYAGTDYKNTRFLCGNAVTDIEAAPGPYDLIICIGLLHHLNDGEAKVLIDSLAQRLAPGGRLVTNDPVYTERQNPIAKKLKDMDSGQNVRTQDGYTALFESSVGELNSQILSGKMNVPYNHCCNILSRQAA